MSIPPIFDEVSQKTQVTNGLLGAISVVNVPSSSPFSSFSVFVFAQSVPWICLFSFQKKAVKLDSGARLNIT